MHYKLNMFIYDLMGWFTCLQFVQEILRHRGDAILREYELTGALQDKTRRQMINLLVAHMQEHYG